MNAEDAIRAAWARPRDPAFPTHASVLIAERRATCKACDVDPACTIRWASTHRECLFKKLTGNNGVVCRHDKWGVFHPGWLRRLKVTYVISTRNEPLLASTCQAVKDSRVDPNVDLDLLVIDDGSDSPARVPFGRVVRNEKPRGIGANLNAGTDIALQNGADVVGVLDSHMRIPKGVLENVARRAAVEKCLACSASYGWENESKMRQWGGYLVKKPRDCFAVRWIGEKWPHRDGEKWRRPEEPWARVQAMIGACYTYSRETIEELRRPTGLLWESSLGCWGWLLEPMAFKATLMRVPVYVSRDYFTRHFYRASNPVKNVADDKLMNICYASGALFSPQNWQRFFERFCTTRAGFTKNQRAQALARRGHHTKRERCWGDDEESDLLEWCPDCDVEEKKREGRPITYAEIVSRLSQPVKK